MRHPSLQLLYLQMQMREVDTYENVLEVCNYFRQSNVETFYWQPVEIWNYLLVEILVLKNLMK